jgi:hypothetical protein
MRIMRRPITGWGMHNHQTIHITPGTPDRPINPNLAAIMRQDVANMSGPLFQGMDPSNPATFTRPWNPQPGMIAQLNFDGAPNAAHNPTGTYAGSQARPRKLFMGGVA